MSVEGSPISGVLEVLATGPLATVQDLGRPGYARWAVGSSGAADRGALRLANRLVGNPEGTAGIEVTLGGLRLRSHAAAVVALTGARCPAAIGGREVGPYGALYLRAGQELHIGAPTAGVRTYVGVRGGIAVEPVLGSRSSDVLAGVGPPVLSAGDELPVGPPAGRLPGVDLAAVAPPSTGEVVLRVLLGPRADHFTAASLRALTTSPWTATSESNRVGVRLSGKPLERAVHAELPSEGMVRGALQVPPSGLPTLLLADHPVTGGYPVIAVVRDDDIDLAAQLRPGQPVRFAGSAIRG